MISSPFLAMRFRSTHVLLCVVLLGLLLVSCGKKRVFPPLPKGDQTVSGILKSAPLSAVRRGSHIIEQEGVDVYYAESAIVNLSTYQGKRVTLHGTIENNVDPAYLPVLVVTSVADVEETTKTHAFADLAMQLSAPVTWKQTKDKDKYVFHLEGDAPADEPILSVWFDDKAQLPDGGVPIVVDTMRATRLIDDLSGAELVAVKQGNGTLFVRFAPGKRVDADKLKEDFMTLLSTVTFGAQGSSSSVATGSGTGIVGIPCGGAAGILCPAGSFCDITDVKENFGRCRTAQKKSSSSAMVK